MQQRSQTGVAVRLSRKETPLRRPPTKAGGLVVRQTRRGYEALLVSSISRPDRWTLPKGGLEPGEEPEAAASREIAEEAGVRGAMRGCLGVVEREPHIIAFYLFRFSHDVDWIENRLRSRRWFDLAEVERHLRQADLHRIVGAARRALEPR
jgi:ADP-ribose pyrophosphatase YjhB (NUDIX family)